MTPTTIVILDGVEQSISEHALDYGIPAELIVARLHRGWDVREAIEIPANIVNGSIGPDGDEDYGTIVNAARTAERLERRALPFGPVPKRYTYDGKSLSINEWALETGMSSRLIRSRIETGWTFGEAIGAVERTVERSPSTATKLYTHDGQTLSVPDWSKVTGLKPCTINGRLRKGLTIGEALTQPKHQKPKKAEGRHTPGAAPKLYTYEGQSLSIRQWALETGIGYSTIDARLKAGWTIEQALTVKPDHTNRPQGPNSKGLAFGIDQYLRTAST